MKSFLASIGYFLLTDLKSDKGVSKDAYDHLFIFPSSRSQAFFEHIYTTKCEGSQWMPRTMTLSQLVRKTSGFRSIDQQEQLLAFVQANMNRHNAEQLFSGVTGWGPRLLKDFDVLVNEEVDVVDFFRQFKELKAIESWMKEDGSSGLASNFVGFWEKSQELYENYVKYCSNHRMGSGAQLIARTKEVFMDQGVQDTFRTSGMGEPKMIHFVGFSALSKQEVGLIQILAKQVQLKFWMDDVSTELKNHPAFHFLQKNADYFGGSFALVGEGTSLPQVSAVSCTGSTEEIQVLMDHLYAIEPEQRMSTVVYVTDEKLIGPILSYQGKEDLFFNTGIGLSLNNFNLMFGLKELLLSKNNYTAIPLKNVQEDVKSESEDERIILAIKKQLGSANSGDSELVFLNRFSSVLDKVLTGNQKKSEINQSILISVAQILKETINQFSDNLKLEIFISPIKIVIGRLNSAELAVLGEKHKGVQVMTPLEGRNLDFENVIFVGFEEEKFSMHRSTFIPTELERHFGLPGFEDLNASVSYHIYRSIKRAKKVTFLFNGSGQETSSGEMARFLTQLDKLHSKVEGGILTYSNMPKIELLPENRIEKTDAVILDIKSYLSERGLSASALNTYLLNPMDFYLQYVLGVREPNDPNPLHPNKIGNVTHKALELIYQQIMKGGEVSQEFIQSKITTALKEEYSTFTKSIEFQTVNTIVQGWVQRLVNLEKEDLKNEIKLLSLEGHYEYTIQPAESGMSFPIKLKGYIDRVDEVNGVTRLIDYKTGKVESKELKLKKEDFNQFDSDYSKANQLLFYTYIYRRLFSPQKLSANIYSFRNSKEGYMSLSFDDEVNLGETVCFQFQKLLLEVIVEMMDPNLPFERVPHKYEKILA